MSTAIRRLSIPLNEKQHQRIKLSATLHGQSIKDYVLERLLDEKTPNETTLRAMRDLEEGRNLGHAKTVDELFEKILESENKADADKKK
jgi:antitoxin component of RelBE/YafQ-DinJ toxin-antitoxin module